ncbi:MAG: rod shape-determining protein [Candidatus Levybacteria bacterium RIFCSPHIGHO2_01_FULL_37_17]|nr:MAG: rod shape-determining protein [Candidatus Levybacteria bacterium RIFCSPHIGHO2_01_FULL_37_17]OGH36606.1 MAG: rod shape-determining protein [Candidatus Levybacteria bacterium RIFCSPLOWO2_01_FULL_38_23]
MLDKLFSLFSYDIGIDLGTANTLVWVRGKGIVIREPSVVAMHKKSKKIIAVGTEAKKMLGKTPVNIVTVRPLKGGVIADFDATLAMITHYIQSVHEIGKIVPTVFSRPRVVIGIPSGVTEVERRAVWEAALSAGAREAFLIEESMASAIGENISVFAPTGIMVVDIGGGTTEVAVISLGGIVVGKSLKIAGDNMDLAIAHYIRLRHGLLIGEKTAEDLKITIGSAYAKGSKYKNATIQPQQLNGEGAVDIEKNEAGEKVAIIRGRDIETGLPKSLKVTEVEVREALAPVLTQIINAVAEILEESPPELTSDILEHGVLLTGGGSKLPGIDKLIVERIHIPVIPSEDPLTSVVRGTGKVLEDESLLARVKVIGGLQ